MKFPDFIIVGAAKCGTTALWYNLDKHPKITMATKTPDVVGMSFWNKKIPPTKEDLKWYKSKFSGYLSGEKTTAYYRSRKGMSNIYKNIPNAKIILCVRNPIDCSYSKFQMDHRAGRISGKITFDLFKKKYAHGKFYRDIKNNILRFFPEENFHICIAEHMKKDITNEMDKVFNFLGVEELGYEGKIVPGVLQHKRSVDIEISRQEKFYRIWSKFTGKIEGELRNKLLKYYKPHNEKFFNLIGFNIEEWAE